jgi:class 3 adenylate cyclase
VQIPDVQYARSGDVAIAYQVIGEGAIDLVWVPFLWNLEYAWYHPIPVRFFERLATFSRLIVLDKRGTGLSDRFRDLPTLETRMDDLRAVLDEVGSERAALLGSFEGAHLTSVFAATYPERTLALLLYNPVARFVEARDYPWGLSEDEWRSLVRDVAANWGSRDFLERHLASVDPTLAEDEEFRRWFVTFFRLGASPGAAAALHRMMMETDVRDILPAIRVPTLVIYREDYREPSCFVAGQIPGAEALEVPGKGYVPSAPPEVFEQIERFLACLGEEAEPDRVLATVLFTDIAGSTERAADLGDRSWRELVVRHHALVRRELTRFRGDEVDTAGDGFFAAFDGPARAIRCACAIRDAVQPLELEVRAGLHTGECELVDGKIGGIAVHTGARVAAEAAPGEVLVSSTVKDLVAGSGIEFEDRGTHELKGVPGAWRLYAVA